MSIFVPHQEQHTAVDGWNEQISQLTEERHKLENSVQEISKVFFLHFYLEN